MASALDWSDEAANKTDLNDLRRFILEHVPLGPLEKNQLNTKILDSTQEWNTAMKRKFSNYKEPMLSEAKVIAQNRMYEREVADRNSQMEHAAAQVPMQFRHNFVKKKYHPPKSYIRVTNLGSFGFDPINQKEYAEPLEFSQKIQYDNFETLVQKCPISKALHMPNTIIAFMDKSESLGFSKLQLVEILSLLILHEQPANFPACQTHLHNPSNFIDFLTKMVNVNLEQSKIIQALKTIRRSMADSVNDTIQNFVTLSYQKSKFSCPRLDEDQHLKKAYKQAQTALMSLVESNTSLELLKFKERRLNDGRICNLEDLLSFLNKLEEKPQFALKSDKYLTNQMYQASEISSSFSKSVNGNAKHAGQKGSNITREPSVRRDNTHFDQSRQNANKSQSRGRTPDNVIPRGRSMSPGNSKFNRHSHSARSQGKNPQSNRSPSREMNKNSPFISRSSTPSKQKCCYRCGSRNHLQNDCRRYPDPFPHECTRCNRGLFHPPSFCNFQQKSRYSSPSPIRNRGKPKLNFFSDCFDSSVEQTDETKN